jgi:hypothetical protein
MCKAPLVPLLVAILTSIGATLIASAREAIMLRAGEATGPNVVFAFDKEANPQAIVVRSTQAGVAGSRVEVNVDSAKKPVFSHIFATEECKFGDGGSTCEVIVPASSRAFAGILNQFKRGRMARVSIQDAGVMKMDETVSLIGVTKALRGL